MSTEAVELKFANNFHNESELVSIKISCLEKRIVNLKKHSCSIHEHSDISLYAINRRLDRFSGDMKEIQRTLEVNLSDVIKILMPKIMQTIELIQLLQKTIENMQLFTSWDSFNLRQMRELMDELRILNDTLFNNCTNIVIKCLDSLSNIDLEVEQIESNFFL